MPCDYHNYPADWRAIRLAILERARNCCEGAPGLYPDCRAENHQPHPRTGSHVVLTVAHLDHDRSNNEPANLRALCQRCHLAYDRDHHAVSRRGRPLPGQQSLWAE